MNLFEKVKKKTDPCWKGYKQLGMKDKDGKEVPNCIPEATSVYDRINKDFKKASGKSLEDASKKYDDIQKKLADQKAKYIAQGTLKESSVMKIDSKGNHKFSAADVLQTARKLSADENPKQKKVKTTMDHINKAKEMLKKIHLEDTKQIDELSTMTLRNYRKEVDNTDKDRPLFKRVKSALGYSRATQKIKNNSIKASAKNEETQLDEISQSTKDSYKEKATDQIKQAEPYAKGKSDVSSFAKRLIDRRKKGLMLATEALSVTPKDEKDPSTYVKKKGVSPEGEHSGRKVRKGILSKIVFDKKNE